MKTAPTPPSFSDGSFTIGGQDVATTTQNADGIYFDYTPSQNQADLYNYSENLLKEYLPKINTLSDNTTANLNSQVEAYKQQGIDNINDIYDPMLTNLKEDVASRFGNLNNSVFFDKLNHIEENRTNAVKDLSTDVLAKRDELTQNQLAQNYEFINTLMGYQDNAFNQALSSINTSMLASQIGNDFNTGVYDQQMANHINNERIRSAERIQLMKMFPGGGGI